MAARGRPPTSVIGTCSSRAARASGFTLLELLAVVVIIAVMLSFVRLSLGIAGPRPDLAQATGRLAESLRLAADEAVLHGRRYGFTADANGYGYLVARGDGWHPLDDPLLGRRELPQGIRLTLSVDGRPQSLAAVPQGRPLMQFTPDGIAPVYQIELRDSSGDVLRLKDGAILNNG